MEELESAKSEENVAPVWAPIFKAMDLAIAVIEKDKRSVKYSKP
jgi:hypothetical protein